MLEPDTAGVPVSGTGVGAPGVGDQELAAPALVHRGHGHRRVQGDAVQGRQGHGDHRTLRGDGAGVGTDHDAVLPVFDPAHRIAAADALLPQLPGHGVGEFGGAAGDAVGRVAGVEVGGQRKGEFGQLLGFDHVLGVDVGGHPGTLARGEPGVVNPVEGAAAVHLARDRVVPGAFVVGQAPLEAFERLFDAFGVRGFADPRPSVDDERFEPAARAQPEPVAVDEAEHLVVFGVDPLRPRVGEAPVGETHGVRPPAHTFAGLDHLHVVSGGGELERGHEPGGARSDHYGVPAFHGPIVRPLTAPRKS